MLVRDHPEALSMTDLVQPTFSRKFIFHFLAERLAESSKIIQALLD
jgi:hypothetical protein